MFALDYREPSHRLADRLPWVALVAPGVILQKDGLLQKTIAVRGPDLGSSSPHELLYAHTQLNNALSRLGSGWAVFFETQRSRVNPYQPARWDNEAAWIVDLERSRTFAEVPHYDSTYFITFVWQPPSAQPPDAWQRLSSFFFSDAGGSRPGADPEREAALAGDISAFVENLEAILRLLKLIFVRTVVLDDEETLTYLHGTVSTRRHRVRVPDVPMYLDTLLVDEAFVAGDSPRLGQHYIRTCTINDFPSLLQPGVLDALNYLPCEYRLVTRWIALDKKDAKQALESYQLRWLQGRNSLRSVVSGNNRRGNFGANENATSVENAMTALATDEDTFGYLTTTVTVWDADFALAREKMELVKQAVQDVGFTVTEERANGREAWLGSLPGNVYPNVRRPILSTRNLVRMLPTNAPWTGTANNEHLRKVSGVGVPHVLCTTSGQTPFSLNLNVEDVGHTLILGPTGAGKSTLLNLLVLQTLKYPRARVIIFDKDRSARAATLAAGGVVLEPGSDTAPVAFQPLRDVGDDRAWASQFVLSLFSAQGTELTPVLKDHVESALERLAMLPTEERTIGRLAHLLYSFDPAYALALQPYYGSGPFAQIFDASSDQLSTGRWTMIETGHLMNLGPQVILPAMLYLMRRMEQSFTGDLTVWPLDEAWVHLSNPIVAEYLRSALKTFRKKNVFVIFATQEVADATRNPLLQSTILSACQTKIFLADPEAETPAMADDYARLGLSPTEIRTLAGMTKKRDYYYRSTLGRRVFSLALGPAQLALVGMSGSKDQQFLDQMVATRPPEEYVEALLERANVTWAVDELRRRRPGQPDAVSGRKERRDVARSV